MLRPSRTPGLRWLWTLLAGCLALPALATEALLEQVGERLQRAELVAGEFEQSQRVAALSRPLVSRGRFVFERERGIFWQVREPVAASLILTVDGRVHSGDGDGGGVAGERALGFMARLLNSVMRGELETLRESFEVTGEIDARAWQLRLTPSSGPLGRVIEVIEVSGNRSVRQVVLRAGDGDSSRLNFHAITFPAALPDYAAALRDAAGGR